MAVAVRGKILDLHLTLLIFVSLSLKCNNRLLVFANRYTTVHVG